MDVGHMKRMRYMLTQCDGTHEKEIIRFEKCTWKKEEKFLIENDGMENYD